MGCIERFPDEAANMTMRSNLIIVIPRKVAGWEVTQAEAARRLRIPNRG